MLCQMISFPSYSLRPSTIPRSKTIIKQYRGPNTWCWVGKSPLRTEAIPLAQNGSSNNQITLSSRFLVVNQKWIIITNLESNANVEDELILPFPLPRQVTIRTILEQIPVHAKNETNTSIKSTNIQLYNSQKGNRSNIIIINSKIGTIMIVIY